MISENRFLRSRQAEATGFSASSAPLTVSPIPARRKPVPIRHRIRVRLSRTAKPSLAERNPVRWQTKSLQAVTVNMQLAAAEEVRRAEKVCPGSPLPVPFPVHRTSALSVHHRRLQDLHRGCRQPARRSAGISGAVHHRRGFGHRHPSRTFIITCRIFAPAPRHFYIGSRLADGKTFS
jgi:hypothetical protein